MTNPAAQVDWLCFAVVPAVMRHVGTALAAARAGSVAILDWEWCLGDPLQAEQGIRNLVTLLNVLGRVPAGPLLGVRQRAGQRLPARAHALLHRVPHWLILSQWDELVPTSLPALVAERSRVVLEVTRPAQLDHVEAWQPHGLLARGHECGGLASADSAFVLTQKLVARSDLPLYVQGGIGVRTASACRAAGACGVVLEDELWLMPEAPLDPEARLWFEAANGQEAVLLGERFGAGCRVYARPAFQVIDTLRARATELEIAELTPPERARLWRECLDHHVGWRAPQQTAWPAGQGVGLAAALRRRYGTTARLIRALSVETERSLRDAADQQPLTADSPLARSHGTTYPIVQGPMTRVSDTAAFAESVARGGGLPMLALALMKAEAVRDLLVETQARLQERPWGVGVLGFVPHQLRAEQMEVVRSIRPAFALIAGGRPDQALQLEAEGIATYLHVPTASLLELFLEQGAHRFVFEGRECGGHVGPLGSFVLWESVLTLLLETVSPEQAPEIHLLFAGGIHDACSAAMVSAMVAPLVARGFKVGVLMGTAYLFTQEAVEGHAILPAFQEVAVACDETINLETGPGHASRCAITPFATEFYDTQRSLRRQQRSPDEIKNSLEDLTLGRLRVASKGVTRQAKGLLSVTTEQQLHDGMYMLGQVATLRSGVTTVAELHAGISLGGSERLAQEVSRLPHPRTEVSESSALPGQPQDDIAIIGIATLLPDADEPAVFWRNIVEQTSSVKEIPAHRWDWRLYFDPDRDAPDRIYSRWGGFLDEIAFDPLQFGIPPASMRSIEPMQLLALEVVRRALADADCGTDREFDREHTSVILGAGGGVGDMGQQYAVRSGLPLVVEQPDPRAWDRLPQWTEESFPGLLLNVAAGRVANRFDFGGSNFIVDAACASSLAALSLAVRELQSGRSNMAIAGGVDTVQNPLAYMCFSKTQALSPSGVPRPFDAGADGITISEGLAVVVLKRRVDAERDGNRIYALIKAVEGSSDGRGLSMTAPRSAGQQRAVQRACRWSRVPPRTIGLYEAHGTGTIAGDRAELETINTILSEGGADPNVCAVGSVKSLIGHTKATAGIAGVIKAALALHHRVRPGHAAASDPLPLLRSSETPVCLLPESRPWLASEHPRRAGVSAFGFGGTNFHALLEEYEDAAPAPVGGTLWPQELLVWRSPDVAALQQSLGSLLEELAAGAAPALRDLAYSCARQFESASGAVSLAIIVADLPELQRSLTRVLEHLRGGSSAALPPSILLNRETLSTPPPVAFLFPGQGSQYLNMASSAALYLPEWSTALEDADHLLAERYSRPLSQFIYPPGAYDDSASALQKQQLNDTSVAQPALAAIEMGYLDLARRLEIAPAALCGHSYGEFTALYAAGCLSREDFLQLSFERGRIMAAVSHANKGAMAAIQAAPAIVSEALSGSSGVVIANYNSPGQTVISGERSQVLALVEAFSAREIPAFLLPVSGAFHSPQMAAASGELAAAISRAGFMPPRVPVFGNATAAVYPDSVDGIRHQLSEHVVSPVHFVGQIEALHAAGIRVFLELGPKNVLADLTDQILDGRPGLAVSLDRRGAGLTGLLTGLAQLLTAGVPMRISELHRDRPVASLNLRRLAATTAPPPPARTAWLIDGGSARPLGEPATGRTGALPKLTLEESKAAPAPSPPDSTAESPPSHPDGSSAVSPGLSPISDASSVAFAPNPAGSLGEAHRSEPLIQIRLTPVSRTSPAAMNASYGLRQHEGSPVAPPLRSLRDSPAPPAAAMSSDSRLAALQSHQETMRQFLALQDRVMSQFLGGTPAAAALPTPAPAPLLRSADAAPSSAARPLDSWPAPAAITPPVKPARVVPQASSPPPSPAASPPPVPAPQMATAAVPAREPLAPAAEASPGAAELDRAGIARLLLELVSDRTGYPTDMLGLDKDIEADLGIDSIKRVEVLGNLRKNLPDGLAPVLQSQMETLSRLKTLDRIIDRVVELAGEAGCLGKSPAAAGRTDSLPRYQMRAVLAPRAIQPTPVQGLCLITEDALGLAGRVADLLEARGVSVVRLPEATLGDLPALTTAVAVARQQGPVGAIVHLAPIGLSRPHSLADWRHQTRISTLALFHLLQLCADDLLVTPGARLLAVSGLGGLYGRRPSDPPSTAGGGHTGLLKTLAQEWPGVCCRAVDCDPATQPEVLSGQLVAELESPEGPVEVGLMGPDRFAFQTIPSPLSVSRLSMEPEAPVPSADWVVLATGGHRGITAEALKAILIPGMTLVILGRSPEPPPESPDTQGVSDRSDLRRRLVESARSLGESPSPAAIERLLDDVYAARDIRSNLAFFRKTCTVDYRVVDVTDGEAFSTVIHDIYGHHGRLDAVIHGAGAIADKLLVDKSPEFFVRVLETKTISAYVLPSSLRFDSLRLLVFFSSVAGRYGSRGQSDYAAANEIMNRTAWQLHWRYPRTRIMAINWGPWDSTGMASEEVKRQFRERGIIPIPMPEGLDFFRREILSGSLEAVEVIAGQGPWCEIDPLTPAVDASAAEIAPTKGPLLQQEPQLQPDSRIGADWFLDPDQPYLRHHRMDARPVLAVAFAAEALAEFVQRAWPEYVLSGIHDLQVLRGITVPEAGLSVRVLARASSHADPLDLDVMVEIVDSERQLPFYRSVVKLSQRMPEAPADHWAPLSGDSMEPSRAYNDFLFHGPGLQLAVTIDAITPEGIDAQCLRTQPHQLIRGVAPGSRWILDPGALDVVPQLAIVWARVQHDTTPLPSRIRQLTQYRAPSGGPLSIQLRVDHFDGNTMTYRARLIDAAGVMLELSGFEGSCSPALNRLAGQQRQLVGAQASSS
jgi:acyl transferase domain-containing protein/NAD(P)H-dependent flavin oxidoreductase YrpB (nitropropane dioxygenase family)/NAD(P)-dependent dehydrogenase (short-subunit alcohol dehydrogenase family)